jgi:hypothetical protein
VVPPDDRRRERARIKGSGLAALKHFQSVPLSIGAIFDWYHFRLVRLSIRDLRSEQKNPVRRDINAEIAGLGIIIA